MKKVFIPIVALTFIMFFYNNCGEFQPTPGNFSDSYTDSNSTSKLKASTKEFTLAILGDTDTGEPFRNSLKLSASEGAEVILINGDFVYENYKDPSDSFSGRVSEWRQIIDEEIDLNKISIIGSIGNHDIDHNSGDSVMEDRFINYFDGFRNSSNQLKSKCTGQKEVRSDKDVILINEVCTFGNVTIALSGINLFWNYNGYRFGAEFFEKELDKKLSNAPQDNWKLAGYHYTLESMNRAGKGDQNTHAFFDIVRQHGAIGAQAHTHAVMATCSISKTFKEGDSVECDPSYENDVNNRWLKPGLGLFLDASLLGRGARPRGECKNEGSDCKHLVDLISLDGYSHRGGATDNTGKFKDPRGVFFIVFNEGGNPGTANAYYKNFDGDILFQFNIKRPYNGPIEPEPPGKPPVEPKPPGEPDNNIGRHFRSDGLYWRVTNEPDGHCRMRSSEDVDKDNLVSQPSTIEKLIYKDNWCDEISTGPTEPPVKPEPNPDDSIGLHFRSDGLYWRVTNEPDGHCRMRSSEDVDKDNLVSQPSSIEKLIYKDNWCDE